MIKVLHVVGARPNFMKIAPIMREMDIEPGRFDQVLVHTGQHYDANMSGVFFDELDLPKPDVNLDVRSGTDAWQTAEVMLRFEPVLREQDPDWVVVVGDVNSTLGCALTCTKSGARFAHVEAGLRSFDRTMPEEHNRTLTDQLADLAFTTCQDANENLRRENVAPERIHLVGNTMIDTLVHLLERSRPRWDRLSRSLGVDEYVLVTLHRPSNVDDAATLAEIVAAVVETSRQIPVVFPVHPRTRRRLEGFDLRLDHDRLHLIEPLGYLDFLALESHARLVVTDSGGVQEETTYLGVPCLTARPNTERPVTITHGTNRLVPSRRDDLVESIRSRLNGHDRPAQTRRPPLWDGRAARRIVDVIGSPAAVIA